MKIRQAGGILLAILTVVVIVGLLGWLRGRPPTGQVVVPVAAAGPAASCTPGPLPSPTLVDSTVVIECPDRFEGRHVAYLGEVVGDVLHRHDGAWLQVNDDDYALTLGPLASTGRASGTSAGVAVWLPDTVAAAPIPGRAGRRGDVLLIEGVFHRADTADGGGTTIRATRTEIIAASQDLDPPVDGWALGLGALLATIGSAAWHTTRQP